jgi:hypothetical protein
MLGYTVSKFLVAGVYKATDLVRYSASLLVDHCLMNGGTITCERKLVHFSIIPKRHPKKPCISEYWRMPLRLPSTAADN